MKQGGEMTSLELLDYLHCRYDGPVPQDLLNKVKKLAMEERERVLKEMGL
jgi:hypothetical protein